VKTHALQAIPHIQRALATLDNDLASSEARMLLRRALVKLEETQTKRDKRNAASKSYAEAALNKDKKWWEAIKEGASKQVDGETLSDIASDLGISDT